MLFGGETSLRARLQAGRKMSAVWLLSGSAVMAELMAEAGFDAAVVDMEHGLGDFTALVGQLQALHGSACFPLVRPPWNDMVLIKRILDAGAHGLIVPCIGNGEEAQIAVDSIRYAPAGRRGLSGNTRAGRYGLKGREYLQEADESVVLFAQIETAAGVDNIDAILETERIDGIFVGPWDLSASLGHFCQPDHPEVVAAIARVEEKTRQAGKALAGIAGDFAGAKQKYQAGYGLVLYMDDLASFARYAASEAAAFKNYYPS